ncbi:MAG: class I SAM-dependent methyltransferase [Patescibacteria group bacterium]|nr:class I SAM-dependent methyltransferase [Patescibacteria group bacterium]
MIGEQNDLRILDVGCGPGGTSISFSRFGTVMGVDYSTTALKISLKRGLNVFMNTLTTISVRDKSFDLITALDVIEHIQDEKKVLIEINRILKSDGFVVITVPAFQFLWSEHDVAVSHVRRYDVSSLSKALNDSGFTIVRISYFVSFVFPFVALYRLLTKSGIKKSNPKPNMTRLPWLVNMILEKIMHLENNIIKKFNFPFGSSIVCIAKKQTHS